MMRVNDRYEYWKFLGFSVKEAKKWLKEGFYSPFEAFLFKKRKLNPKEAKFVKNLLEKNYISFCQLDVVSRLIKKYGIKETCIYVKIIF